MRDLVQRVSLYVILPKGTANYKEIRSRESLLETPTVVYCLTQDRCYRQHFQ